ncbi:MAG TPA: DUF4468 domain-containing protein [Candidatus Omnitrophota bacterium]|nr:DUF4468 domain-containing protein [Candidatus Omnitrophota bacterium]
MKKYAVLLGFLAIFMVGCVSTRNLDTTLTKDQEVITVKGSKSDLYINTVKFASTQRMRIDTTKVVTDQASGLVAFSTGDYITESSMGWRWFASYTMTVECKDNKLRITVANPMYEYTNGANSRGAGTTIEYVNGQDIDAIVKDFNMKLNQIIDAKKKELVAYLEKSSSF